MVHPHLEIQYFVADALLGLRVNPSNSIYACRPIAVADVFTNNLRLLSALVRLWWACTLLLIARHLLLLLHVVVNLIECKLVQFRQFESELRQLLSLKNEILAIKLFLVGRSAPHGPFDTVYGHSLGHLGLQLVWNYVLLNFHLRSRLLMVVVLIARRAREIGFEHIYIGLL